MSVNCTIQSIHFDADKKLLDLIEKRVNKLDRFFDKIIEAEVYLRLEESKTADNKIVEIKLKVPGNDMFAKKKAEKFEVALDLAVEAIKKQIEKKKI